MFSNKTPTVYKILQLMRQDAKQCWSESWWNLGLFYIFIHESMQHVVQTWPPPCNMNKVWKLLWTWNLDFHEMTHTATQTITLNSKDIFSVHGSHNVTNDSTAQHSTAGTARCNTARHGAARRGTARHGTASCWINGSECEIVCLCD